MSCRYNCAHLNTDNVMMVTVRPNRERVVPIIESVSRATWLIGDCSCSQPSVLVQMSCKCEPRIKLSHNCQFNHQCSMPLLVPHFQLCNLCVKKLHNYSKLCASWCWRPPTWHSNNNKCLFSCGETCTVCRNHFLTLTKIPWYYSEDVLVTYHQNGKVGKVVAPTSCHTVILTTEFTSISSPISASIYGKSVNLDLQALNAKIKMWFTCGSKVPTYTS